VGVLQGGVKPGCTVAIIGAGPVGLAALCTAQLYSPSTIVMIDKDESRLKVAKTMGATHTVNPDSAKTSLHERTKEHHGEIDGFDVVIEAVGLPATLEACQDLVGKGGAIANVGVHGAKCDLHMEKLWIRGISESSVAMELMIRKVNADITNCAEITMAIVNTDTLPMLLKLFQAGKLNTQPMITHGQNLQILFRL